MRIVFLCDSGLDDFQFEVLAPFWASKDVEVVGACIDGRAAEPRTRKFMKELEKGRGGYVVVMALSSLFGKRASRSAVEYFQSKGIDLTVVDSLYDESTLGWIRQRRPDCIFRMGFGIIREPVLSLAPNGVISYHHGDLRKYRGQPVGFWELYRGEGEMGVCVQVLDEELDAGRIVIEKRVPIYATDSWRSLENRCYAASRQMAIDACVLLNKPSFAPQVVPRAELGHLYTTPNFRQWLTLQGRVALRRLRNVAKAAPRL